MEHQIRIRAASLEDAASILEIYRPYVEKTAVTFEYTTPSPDEFRDRMRGIMAGYPYLVAEYDGVISGYAYLRKFVGRAAYDWAAETTIYIEETRRENGIGGRLYRALERIAAHQHITNLNACIAYPEPEDEYLTRDSAAFHARMGYEMAGRFHQCGYKFGRWYDMIWMEKIIGVHEPDPKPVIPFPKLDWETADRLMRGEEPII